MIKKTRPRRKILLNPGIKSTARLIKNEYRTRLAKQRSIIKGRKLNSLIEPCTDGRKSNSNNPNGSSIKRVVATYPFIPVKLHLLLKKSREWIKFASQKKGIKPSIPVKLNILINKDVLANRVTCSTRLVSYNAKVKSFPDKPSVLINNSTLGNRATYSEVNYPFNPVEYIAINKRSNIMKEKSILRIDRSTLVGAYSFQKRTRGTQLPTFLIPARTILW